jgi:hypothetical protein
MMHRQTAFVISLALALAPATAHAMRDCRVKSSPPVAIKDTGGLCNFDSALLSYAGTPAEQARCLLNPVQQVGRLGPPLTGLPDFLASHIGTATGLPERTKFGAWLHKHGFLALAEALDRPVSFARDGDPTARPATYFVVHDTSTPNYRDAPWPKNIDGDAKINNLDNYRCRNNVEVAHVFINRQGAILIAHDLSVPWRATKFEMAANFDNALKGLFLHVELIQPRRRHPRYGRGNDFTAPDPGFSVPQYEALAVVYTAASLRAGLWMVPAYHSVIDEGIPNKHDDPQNFVLGDFANALVRLLAEIERTDNPSFEN